LCHHYWETHSGWDQGGRDFVSIPAHFSINTQTAHALPPELFSVAEAFANLNSLSRGNTEFSLTFPAFAADGPSFVALQRRFLESARDRVSDWIDLVFGFARDGPVGVDRLNVFPAMLCPEPPRSAPDHSLLECGQVPFRVFPAQHPRAAPAAAISPTVEAAHPPAIRNSDDGFRIATNGSEVRAMRNDRLITRIFANHPRFSVLFAAQRLCYTACAATVVVWSIATGSVIREIELAGVALLAVSPEKAAVFAARGSEVVEFGVNGAEVRRANHRNRRIPNPLGRRSHSRSFEAGRKGYWARP
jgi:hypothetical protein